MYKVKGKGKVAVSVGQMKALTVKMERVTLIVKGRQNVTCNVCINFIIYQRSFFSVDILFLECVIIVLEKFTSTWQTCFIWGVNSD